MTRPPTVDQLRNLTDRADRGPLQPAEVALLRAGIDELAAHRARSEPAPATPGRRWTVTTQVDTHTCTGDAAATTVWLAGHPHHWDADQLIIDTVDGPIPAPHGYLLARWPDGDITVMSPRAAAKRLRA
ncbi:hypothetical protein [Streptomyces stelliscabiei]|uniref:hypothetical protein n=1 Tax=Streptomyces stelliscabiei TaxID=146820 RepID=UPI002FEFEBCE